ncbi:PIR protein CIR protein [Plasmodium vinckei vinckei]|uniref:PIR protein CIR protein n=1 Tax=Plasmodium vinckei vinckei TaxID=54757 RepID=A0A449BM80_PLAVN|nr:PIR protein CIR protein [Plasmodium vinckei vinckei]VEV54551.1 PIR protein CIR protein [Plasmodium vinckei vinckei]
MENSNYNIEKVYREFATIDDYFYVTEDCGFRVNTEHTSILQYCNYSNSSGKYTSDDYFQLASCSVIHLLEMLKKYKLEDDKLAEYVILWLSYKLNAVPEKCSPTNLNDFYNSYIVKNNDYNEKIKNSGSTTYKDIIDTKKDLIDMNNNEISKFNDPFSILFYLYNVFHDNHLKCKQYSGKAKEFVRYFKELNDDSNINGNTLYKKLLSTLSDDYDNLKKIYHDTNKCTDFPSISDLTSQKSSGKDSEQPGVLSSEATSSSSSILNTVIPALSTLAIPVFLGVAYKTIYKKKIKKNKEENET